MSNVNNYCIAVKEKGDDIVFLRKIVKGGADKSWLPRQTLSILWET